ncbi:hypothetical protein D3C81_1220830 [compost metagenome]
MDSLRFQGRKHGTSTKLPSAFSNETIPISSYVVQKDLTSSTYGVVEDSMDGGAIQWDCFIFCVPNLLLTFPGANPLRACTIGIWGRPSPFSSPSRSIAISGSVRSLKRLAGIYSGSG